MIDAAKHEQRQDSVETLRVLLLEDNPLDSELTLRELRKGGFNISADTATNAEEFTRQMEEAMALLRRKGKYVAAPRPDLVLAGPELAGIIPVVILTTSASEVDILRSYQLHANCFVTKPVDLEQFLIVVKSIDNFWLTVVKLPIESAG